MGSNGASNHFIAIPISGINGRIDIDVYAPYASSSTFTIRAVLDTSNGTNVGTSAPSSIAKAALDVNKYDTDHFNFRMTDISATSGVLYIGRASSSYKNIEKIYVYTPANYLVPAKTATTIGDNGVDTIAVANYTSYNAIIKSNSNSSVATATFNPSTGKLAIAGVAPGTTTITLVVDEDGDGVADDGETKTATVTVTVHGITVRTQPASDVYEEGDDITALSVTATHTDAGTLKYQWYKNTVNSTTGGEKVGTNSASYTPSLTAEANAFYYCEVSVASDTIKSHTTDVAYVLYSSTKRYFQMSNVAGNRNSSTNDEKITGQVIAGGQAYVQTDGDYRYITRPSTSVAHTYVASNSTYYFKIVLAQAIQATDIATVLINDLGGGRGITISSTDGTKTVTIDAGTASGVNSYAASLSALAGETTIYVKGKYAGTSNYFTDLIFSESTPLAVSTPTPASQSVQVGDRPATISVTATGSTGSYTYQWYRNTSESTEGAVLIADGTSASYTPKTLAAAVDSVYYCLVNGQTSPTGYATVDAVALSHGYLTLASGDFTDNEYLYLVDKDNYAVQNTDPATSTTCYWDISKFRSWGRDGSETALAISGIDNTERKYVRINTNKNQGTFVFYVKNATAFSIQPGITSSRTFDVYVDDVKVGSSCSADPTKETSTFALNKDGSKIKITNPSGDIYVGRFRFYQKQPATIEVQENGEAVTSVTQYIDGGAKTYEVVTDGDGTISATSGTPGVATVSYSNGTLTVTPQSVGTSVITVSHTGGTSYGDASTTLTVTVSKHVLKLAFSYDEASFKASALTESSVIPSGSLPELIATLDGVEVTGSDFTALGIMYKTDDRTIGYFGNTDSPAASRADEGSSYTVKYGGGQGGAVIYAYVDNRSDDNVSSAKASFQLVVTEGTSNALPDTAKAGADKSIYEQKQFRLANSSGVEVVRLIYGGYKYNKEGRWNNVKTGFSIDGFSKYTNHEMDAYDEYGYQLRGMLDEPSAASGNAEKQYTLTDWSSKNVGSHTFWYTTNETKPDGTNYGKYERLRPFMLPSRGGYLKFEPKQTGKLTVYVYQNGTYSGGALGTKPRLGYWFDQDGWVQHPTVAPVTKQPLSKGMGSNTINLTTCDTWTGTWVAENDDADIKKLLTNKWSQDERPTESTADSRLSNAAEKPDGWYANPYYWYTESEISTNLDEEQTIISKKMDPVPYHNGYLVPEATCLKYVLNVVAGKTYYFYGMMTKVGYMGMNFVEDESVISSFEHKASLHLNATDYMATVVSNQTQDYTVYDEVTLPSSYKKNQWYTICLPFALSENQVEKAFGKGTQLAVYNGLIEQGGGNYTIKFLSHVDQNILPGQPYLIKPSGVDASGDDLANVDGVIGSAVEVDRVSSTRITFNTVCIDKPHFSQAACNYGNNANVNLSGVATGNTDFEFTGTYSPVTPVRYSYIMSKSDGILKRWEGTSGTLDTYHAYVKATSSRATGGTISLVKGSAFENTAEELDNEPTAVPTIEEVAEMLNNGSIVPDGRAYNMMGQEIDPTAAKGMVIMNGKKYMLK